VTSAGIDVRASVVRLIKCKHAHGHTNGPAIFNLAGNVLSHQAMNDTLLEVLEELFNTHRELFPGLIPDKETLRVRIQVYHTLQ
jgi:hypothetical protein